MDEESQGAEQGCKKTLTEKSRENPWIISTVVLGIVALIFIFGNFSSTGSVITGGVVSEVDAGSNLLAFANEQVAGGVELLSMEDYDDYLYLATLEIQGDQVPVYVTKDGKYLISSLMSLEVEETADTSSQEVVKSDKPVVELFVMTHCPYGTQAEKGILPVFELLGDKIDGNIRFVHYFMHEPETEETPRQTCIREEQASKYNNYLKYFLGEGVASYAISKSGVSIGLLNECISKGNGDNYYAEDSELSQAYGVQGSPTLVINGEVVSSGRDAQSYLDTICSAFTDAPEECSEVLSSSTPSAGFGYDTGTATSAQC